MQGVTVIEEASRMLRFVIFSNYLLNNHKWSQMFIIWL